VNTRNYTESNLKHKIMKILITGPHGMLGTDIVSLLQKENVEVLEAPHEKLDITHEDEVLSLALESMPDIIINCAAFTNVDKCETEKETAYKVNATGPKNIAIAAKRCGAKVIQISTDFVFDGNSDRPYIEDDKTNPLSEYGRSKLEGEINIRSNNNNFLIVRTSWLFGRHGINFVDKMLELAQKNKELSIVDDETGSPTYTVDLAGALWALIEEKSEGIFHVSNEGSCSRYEWARKIFEIADYDIKIHPIKSHQYKRPAKVPLNSTLNCQKLTTLTGMRMSPWEDTLKAYLK